MKIVMIGQKGLPAKFGGVETHVEHLATRLVRAGHQVFAYARFWYTSNESSSYNGITVKRLPSLHTKHLDTISHTFIATVHALIFVRPDVYHYHGVGPSLLAWLPRVLAPKATVVTTFHSLDRLHEKWGRFARAILRLGEKATIWFGHTTITVSKNLASYIKSEFATEAVYIPNGVAQQRVATDSILLEPFGLRPFSYVVMVARLVPHKGAHTLIEAWKLAKAKEPQLFKDLKLAVVGGSVFTDKYVTQLEQLAGSDKSIVMTGFQSGDSLQALFAGSRFAVHPSTNEGLSLTVLEAMSYGKAVIAADIPENQELVGEYGLTFSPNEAEDLADKLIALVQDPMLAAGLGHVARIHVEEAFNWDDIAKDTLKTYAGKGLAPTAVLATE